MKKNLTARWIETVNGGEARQEFTDTATANLVFIVQPSGKKSWAWRGRVQGKVIKITLGGFPSKTLADARAWAGEINEARDLGEDITRFDPRRAEPTEAPEPAPVEVKSHRTLDWMFDLYMEHEGDGRRTAKEKRQIYEREVKPTLGDKVVEDITYNDLAGLIRNKAKSAPGASNNLQVQIKRLFRWAVTHGRDLTGLENDVARDLVKFGAINKRARHFDDYEIGVFFKAVEQCWTQINEGLVFILYTGVRRSEAFDAEWTEFDLEKGIWVIPPERVKNNTEHVVPLPEEMVMLLKERHKLTGDGKYVWPSRFTAKREEPSAIDQFTKPRAKLAEVMDEIAAKDKKKIAPWTIHDLRRTLSSGMNALLDEDDMPKIDPDTVERVINHKIGGVAGVYNRYQYFAPKKRALRLWADHLAEIKSAASASTG